jgi:DNA-binding transcriptional regulator YiaG
MPNLLLSLKQEIQRLARKEVRAAVLPLKKERISLKRSLRDLRNQVTLLEKQNRALNSSFANTGASLPTTVQDEEGHRVRITAKGMKSLRRKLKLTQAEFAKLLGVSSQSVWQWEQKSGAIRIRNRTREALLNLRNKTSKEVKQQLNEPKPKRNFHANSNHNSQPK